MLGLCNIRGDDDWGRERAARYMCIGPLCHLWQIGEWSVSLVTQEPSCWKSSSCFKTEPGRKASDGLLVVSIPQAPASGAGPGETSPCIMDTQQGDEDLSLNAVNF